MRSMHCAQFEHLESDDGSTMSFTLPAWLGAITTEISHLIWRFNKQT
jgi:hypothetical protein